MQQRLAAVRSAYSDYTPEKIEFVVDIVIVACPRGVVRRTGYVTKQTSDSAADVHAAVAAAGSEFVGFDQLAFVWVVSDDYAKEIRLVEFIKSGAVRFVEVAQG